jgi:hypothetical protein
VKRPGGDRDRLHGTLSEVEHQHLARGKTLHSDSRFIQRRGAVTGFEIVPVALIRWTSPGLWADTTRYHEIFASCDGT